ncbi:MAG: signal recognition particle-docking protein FtsY, partial [Candidatus Woesearchaeota archaeon]|nr:signal recognition particle-docking protein FtsY [Candidatus Woesearchaeota archaeon]
MFKFLKEKLKNSVSSISKKIDDEGKEDIIEEEVPVEESSEVKEEEKKVDVSESEEVKEESSSETKEKDSNEENVEEEPKKKGFFAKLKEKFVQKEEIDEEGFEEVHLKSEIEGAIKEKEVEKEEEKLSKKDGEIKEKVEKKETPSIQELNERKEQEEKVVEKKEDKVEEKEEVKVPVEEPPKVEGEVKEGVVSEEEKVDTEKEEIIQEKKSEEIVEDKEEVEETKTVEDDAEEEPKKKGFFGRIKEKIVTKKINESQFEEIFWNLETALLENNIAVEVIDKIKDDLKVEIVDTAIKRGKIEETIEQTLRKSIKEILEIGTFDIVEKIKGKKPFVICFLGINGSGKTTSIAKFTDLLKNEGLKVVLAAADTFRAASIEQLQAHAEKLDVKLIKQDYGADPAAVAFDAIDHAKSKDMDVVLIDTAGRMHSNINLIDELKKVVRVAKPDLKIFVGESITGNDCVEQAKKFDEAVGVDGVILTKSDIDEKGGAMISVSYVTKKPILYLGTGQEYKDLKKFDSSVIV